MDGKPLKDEDNLGRRVRASEHFSASYADARDAFLAEARRRGFALTSYEHPLRGRDGETLALDVARLGDPHAARVLIVSSACHGVEGYCGSGVQIAALRVGDLVAKARDAGVGLVFMHALNPYGFSHIRRVTEENIDLNRNFVNFSAALPENSAYRELHGLMIPRTWPPDLAHEGDLLAFVAARGERAIQAALSSGQYEFPEGLLFGGRGPTWSHRALRKALRDHAAGAERRWRR